MTKNQSAYDASQGNPNLEVLQWLRDNWTPADINASAQVAKVSVATGSAGIAAVIPVGAEIIDAHVICTGSNGSGTMQVQTAGGTAISDAMVCATNDALIRAATIDSTYKIVDADGVMVVANDDADLGDVYIFYKK